MLPPVTARAPFSNKILVTALIEGGNNLLYFYYALPTSVSLTKINFAEPREIQNLMAESPASNVTNGAQTLFISWNSPNTTNGASIISYYIWWNYYSYYSYYPVSLKTT